MPALLSAACLRFRLFLAGPGIVEGGPVSPAAAAPFFPSPHRSVSLNF